MGVNASIEGSNPSFSASDFARRQSGEDDIGVSLLLDLRADVAAEVACEEAVMVLADDDHVCVHATSRLQDDVAGWPCRPRQLSLEAGRRQAVARLAQVLD